MDIEKRKERVNIMGLAIDAIEFQDAVKLMEHLARKRPASFACVISIQDIVIGQTDLTFRRIVNQADLATADGWPIVWNLRFRGNQQTTPVTGPDLMWEVCARSPKSGLKHYLYGGAAEIPKLLTERLEQSFPGIDIVGACTPPFRELTGAESAAIVQKINESNADVLWLGISTPRQHYWVEAHRDRLNVGLIVTVGAAFDFHSGRVLRAPTWMRNNGLEWFHRIMQEPRRLGNRYASFIPRFLLLNFFQLLALKKFSISGCKRNYGH